MKKVLFISSTGGHFSELMQLKPMFEKYKTYIMTEKTKSHYETLKKQYGKNVGFIIYGTKENGLIRYLFKLLGNCFISLYYFIKWRPKYIVTTGAHNTGPMCCIAKLFRSKIIFIESYANVKTKTLTGKLVYKFADLFIVQHKEMLELYKNAKYVGGIF